MRKGSSSRCSVWTAERADSRERRLGSRMAGKQGGRGTSSLKSRDARYQSVAGAGVRRAASTVRASVVELVSLMARSRSRSPSVALSLALCLSVSLSLSLCPLGSPRLVIFKLVSFGCRLVVLLGFLEAELL